MPIPARLTCVIPTHNRPHFLRRLMHFYEQCHPHFPFLVMDSSEPAAAAENVAILQGLSSRVNASYRHLNKNMIEKGAAGLKTVNTPYVVFCADDDILLPNAVWQCVDFLEDHPGHESAIGWMSDINVRPTYMPDVVHQGYSIEDDRPYDRCRKIANFWFTNFYGVHRTATLSHLMQLTSDHTDSLTTPHLAEQMLSLLSVMSGRVKVLPMISSVVECHGMNSSITTHTGIQLDSESLYQRFRQCIADQLEQTGVARLEAERFIDRSYGHFRHSQVSNRRRRRSIAEQAGRFLMKTGAFALHHLGLDQHRRIAVKRMLRSSDYATSGPMLRQAQELIREYPQGIPAMQHAERRAA